MKSTFTFCVAPRVLLFFSPLLIVDSQSPFPRVILPSTCFFSDFPCASSPHVVPLFFQLASRVGFQSCRALAFFLPLIFPPLSTRFFPRSKFVVCFLFSTLLTTFLVVPPHSPFSSLFLLDPVFWGTPFQKSCLSRAFGGQRNFFQQPAPKFFAFFQQTGVVPYSCFSIPLRFLCGFELPPPFSPTQGLVAFLAGRFFFSPASAVLIVLFTPLGVVTPPF